MGTAHHCERIVVGATVAFKKGCARASYNLYRPLKSDKVTLFCQRQTCKRYCEIKRNKCMSQDTKEQ